MASITIIPATAAAITISTTGSRNINAADTDRCRQISLAYILIGNIHLKAIIPVFIYHCFQIIGYQITAFILPAEGIFRKCQLPAGQILESCLNRRFLSVLHWHLCQYDFSYSCLFIHTTGKLVTINGICRLLAVEFIGIDRQPRFLLTVKDIALRSFLCLTAPKGISFNAPSPVADRHCMRMGGIGSMYSPSTGHLIVFVIMSLIVSVRGVPPSHCTAAIFTA